MKKTERAELVSIVGSVFMAAAMILVARLTGSVGILAEGIDTVVDVIASLAVLAGMKLSERRTRSFPQGLHKLENVIAASIGMLILVSAWELGKESVQRILEGSQPISQPWLVIGVMGGVVFITGALAWYKNKVGNEENSPSLKADASHSWTDVLASAAVAGGVFLQMVGIPHMDSVAALIVVAVLIWSGIQIVLDGLRVLLDASIEKEVIDQARQFAANTAGVKKVINIEGRNSGSYRFIRLSIVPDTLDLKEAGEIAEDVKATIRSGLEHVDRVDVEFDLEPRSTFVSAVPLTGDGNSISEDFGRAPLFGFFEVSPSQGTIIREDVIPNPIEGKGDCQDIWTAVFLAKRGVNAVLLKGEFAAQGFIYVLGANDIEITRLAKTTDIGGVREYLAGEEGGILKCVEEA